VGLASALHRVGCPAGHLRLASIQTFGKSGFRQAQGGRERLQGAAEELNATIVASATTYEAVRELFVGIPTSSIPLRGLKRLQNAYIVRGLTKRAAEDDLLVLPKERYFKQTVVRPDETLYEPEPAPAEYIPRRAPAPRDEIHRFSAFDDDRPAMPAPPPLSGTYEDDDGPPVPLPP